MTWISMMISMMFSCSGLPALMHTPTWSTLFCLATRQRTMRLIMESFVKPIYSRSLSTSTWIQSALAGSTSISAKLLWLHTSKIQCQIMASSLNLSLLSNTVHHFLKRRLWISSIRTINLYSRQFFNWKALVLARLIWDPLTPKLARIFINLTSRSNSW